MSRFSRPTPSRMLPHTGSKTAAPTRSMTMPDFHATILHLLGFDHERLTYRHAGRDYRLTDVQGNVVRDVLA